MDTQTLIVTSVASGGLVEIAPGLVIHDGRTYTLETEINGRRIQWSGLKPEIGRYSRTVFNCLANGVDVGPASNGARTSFVIIDEL